MRGEWKLINEAGIQSITQGHFQWLCPIGNLVNLTNLKLSGNPIKPMTETEMTAAYGEVVSSLIIKAIVQVERINDWVVYSVNWKLLKKYEGVGFEDVGELNLGSNYLTRLPDSIGNLVNLTELELNDNQLTSIPDSTGKLVNLEYLNLAENQLTSIPESIGKLVNLTGLSLSDNELTSLPESIGNLVKLKWLNLMQNQLSSLPDSIGNLVNLTSLYLSGNQLTSLPDSIGNLVNLTSLKLTKNPIKPMTETEMTAAYGEVVNPIIIEAIIAAN